MSELQTPLWNKSKSEAMRTALAVDPGAGIGSILERRRAAVEGDHVRPLPGATFASIGIWRRSAPSIGDLRTMHPAQCPISWVQALRTGNRSSAGLCQKCPVRSAIDPKRGSHARPGVGRAPIVDITRPKLQQGGSLSAISISSPWLVSPSCPGQHPGLGPEMLPSLQGTQPCQIAPEFVPTRPTCR